MPTAKPASQPSLPERRQAFLEALGLLANVTKACGASGLPRASAYRLRKDDTEFAEAWAEALDIGTDALEDEAVRRATEGVEENVFYQGEIVGTQRKYSDSLLVLLLRARRPDKFRDSAAQAGKLIPPPLIVTLDDDDDDDPPAEARP